ncbi:MAG: hypothetical protein NTV48_02240 [Candidatus Vogelbacteria bacterium]|nr:hypothetical protein [Candidatus Vogelbacteria bacterium]
MEKIKDLTKTKTFRGVLFGLVIAVVVLFIFQVGVFVGFRKASFAYQFGDNYYRMFEGRGPEKGKGPGIGGMMRDDLQGGHGVVGKIIKVDLPTVVVLGSDNLEKIVLVDDDTAIKQFRNQASSTDLKIGDMVVVIGTPNNQGQVEAKLIRLMPKAPVGLPVTPSPKTN